MMPRPVRLLKAETCYVVSHKTKKPVFLTPEYRQIFCDVLASLPQRFDCLFHAYVLQDSRYFLYLKTHKANLDLILRQLHAVFSQMIADEIIFEKRARVVVIEPERYRAAILAYFHHLNALASSQSDYEKNHFPAWLAPLEITRPEAFPQRLEEVQDFFSKQRWRPILGSKHFEHQLLRGVPKVENRQHYDRPEIDDIVQVAAKVFNQPIEGFLKGKRGPGKQNLARSAAICYARDVAGYPLKDIAAYFLLSHFASVANIAKRFMDATKKDGLLNACFCDLSKRLEKNK